MRTWPRLAALLASLLPAQALAAPDLFGREGYYDLTGAPEIRDLGLDYDYIRRDVPSYAEQLGLAGAPTVEIRRNFIYIEDSDGTLRIPFQSFRDLSNSFNFALRELYLVLPDEFVFVYLFTSFDTRVGAFFYQPEANSTRGLGTQTYDMNGASPREGFIFMNWYRAMESMFGQFGQQVVQGQARSIFNQEAGHRWCCFTDVAPGAEPDVMLGRDDSHWSYFAHTGASPLEGNFWRDNGNGTFTTATSVANWRFSDVDLYLMGLIPTAMVQPWFVITSPTVLNGGQDLQGQTPTRTSPPQIVFPVTVRGTRTDFTIDDLIRRNGNRVPAHPDAPTRFRVVFAMLASQAAPLTEAQRLTFEGLVDDYATGFKQGARDLAELDYVLREPVQPLPIGGECVDGGAPCEDGLFCLPGNAGAPGVCTKACAVSAECPSEWCCADLSGTGSFVCQSLASLGALACPSPPTPMSPDAGTAPACACDSGPGCQTDCACDAECVGQPAAPSLCACDTTTACDPDGAGKCACDPECGSGCGCAAVPGGSRRNRGADLALAGAVLLFGYFFGSSIPRSSGKFSGRPLAK